MTGYTPKQFLEGLLNHVKSNMIARVNDSELDEDDKQKVIIALELAVKNALINGEAVLRDMPDFPKIKSLEEWS